METKGRILVVGMGGLGAPAALALARGGVRSVGIADPDGVELSNLHRQVIYGGAELGMPKVEAAARHLARLNPEIEVEKFPFEIDASNARALIAHFAFVIDGTDNPAAKFALNDACIAAGRPFVYGGVLGMGGQAMTVRPGRTACLRCVFEEPPVASEIASCREAGIVGPVAGLIGEIQAREALRFFSGGVPELAGAILTYDGAQPGRIRVIRVNPRPGCPCGAYREARGLEAAARN